MKKPDGAALLRRRIRELMREVFPRRDRRVSWLVRNGPLRIVKSEYSMIMDTSFRETHYKRMTDEELKGLVVALEGLKEKISTG